MTVIIGRIPPGSGRNVAPDADGSSVTALPLRYFFAAAARSGSSGTGSCFTALVTM